MIYEAELLAQSEYILKSPAYVYLQTIKLICFSIYLLEIILFLSAYLGNFFYDIYNVFNLFVLIDYIVVWVICHTFPYFSSFVSLRILRGTLSACITPGLQILRIFRLIPLITSLELVVNALLQTLRTSVLDVLFLAFIVIFILGTFGHYSFGLVNDGSESYLDWNTLPQSFLTVWVFISGDNWLPFQDRLRQAGHESSYFFSVLLMVIGNFMVSNLFIGVISQNVYEASQAERLQVLHQQKEAKMLKRDIFLKKQQRDLLQLVQRVLASINHRNP